MSIGAFDDMRTLTINSFIDGANLIYKQLLISPSRTWGEGTIRLANGYAQAIHKVMTALSASEIAMQLSTGYSDVYFVNTKLLIKHNEEKFPAMIKFLQYWEERLPEIQRYLNLS